MSDGADTTLDLAIARLLMAGTYLSVALIAVGVTLLIGASISPLRGGPRFDLARLIGDLLAVRPEGFLWLGLVLVIATPSARVAASLVGYFRRGERSMSLVAAAILAVIALSVALSLIGGPEP
jgi:uncharacterized membrane protein